MLALAAPAGARAEAVTYQANARHDGNAGDAGLRAPLHRAWTARVDGRPGYPVIGGGRVFVVVEHDPPGYQDTSEVLALSAANGRVLWRMPLAEDRDVGLALDGGRLFVARDSHQSAPGIQALDAATGRVEWEAPFEGGGEAPVAFGGAVYASSNHDQLHALAQADGAPLWTGVASSEGSPTFAAGGSFASLACDRVVRGRMDGSVAWETPGSCNPSSGPTVVVHDGRVYDQAGETATVRDAATGAPVARWPFTQSPSFAPGVGLFPHQPRRPREWGGHALVARDLPSGRVRWRFNGDGYIDTPALIANGVAYAGSGRGRLYGLSLRRGRRVWRARLGVPVAGGLAAADGLLAVPAYNRVVAFR